jgi:hypothetical protein
MSVQNEDDPIPEEQAHYWSSKDVEGTLCNVFKQTTQGKLDDLGSSMSSQSKP